MDLLKIIKDLHDERDRIDRVIASLDALSDPSGAPPAGAAPKRRGRKHMGEAEREQVATRMKEYWRKKRDQS